MSGRAMEELKYFFRVDNLPMLMSSTRVAELVILDAHTTDHGGRDTILVTATRTAWIVGSRRLAGKVVSSLHVHQVQAYEEEIGGGKDGTNSGQSSCPAPPFTHMRLDLFGPMSVKKMGGAKTNREMQRILKVCRVLIVYLNTIIHSCRLPDVL